MKQQERIGRHTHKIATQKREDYDNESIHLNGSF